MRQSQTGFSLIELMLALALGAVVLTGIVQLFLANTVTYNVLHGQARLQENGRMALEFIGRSVRSAGYYGCAPEQDLIEYGLNGPTLSTFEFHIRRPIQAVTSGDQVSIDSSIAGNAGVPNTTTGAILAARTLGAPRYRLAEVMQPDGNPVVLVPTGEDAPEAGQTVLLSDCDQAVLFRVTGVTSTGNQSALLHANEPGSFNNRTGKRMAPNGLAYGRDAVVAPFRTTIFFVAPSATNSSGNNTCSNAATTCALWVKEGTTAPVELVTGVQNLEVLFGLDDQYVGTYSAAIADRIRSVRVSVTANSIDTVDGQRLSRTFTETMNLRNRR